MNLFVIGNGFDRYHSLATSYSDFKTHLGNSEFVDILEEIYTPILWKDFEKQLAEIKIDEDEFERFVHSYVDEDDEFENDMVKDHFLMHICSELKYAFVSWIKRIEINTKDLLSEEYINNDNLYLNFNYTSTLESVYKINKENILHIHGCVDNTSKLIFGHNIKYKELDYEDTDYVGLIKDEDVQYDRLMNMYLGSTFKDTEHIIKANLCFFEKIKEVENVYILGHSLSEIDLSYFKQIDIYTREKCKTWNVTYFTDIEQEEFITKLKSLEISEQKIKTIKMIELEK